jgi:hypothetical protein
MTADIAAHPDGTAPDPENRDNFEASWLDFKALRRYIRRTFRQAVSFASSDGCPGHPSLGKHVTVCNVRCWLAARRQASTIEA